MTSLSHTESEFAALADGARPVVVRVSTELPTDLDPVTAYSALKSEASDYAFLLESGEKVASSDPDGAFRPTAEATDRHARYSFVGYDPAAVITVSPGETHVEVLGPQRYEALLDGGGDGPLDRLRNVVPEARRAGFKSRDRQQLDGGLVGTLAYDAVYDLELAAVGVDRPPAAGPSAEYLLATRTLTFDEVADTVELVFTPVLGPDDNPERIYRQLAAEADRVRSLLATAESPPRKPAQITDETAGSREAYETAVQRTKEHVFDGDIYQGVVSRRRELRGDIDPVSLYMALRDINPSPYMYLLSYDDRHVVGASPETLVSVRNEEVMVNPIAGTCPRGSSPVEDRRLAGEMLADEKERSEHTMLVDLARNDVRRVATPGSVQVDEFMNVLKYSHVQHIESTVTGQLRPECDAFDAARAAFPAGTLTGAPKIRAMEIIDELESAPRGVYGGGVGYFSWTGDADTAIIIRTATLVEEEEETRMCIQAGAGIVADSDPPAEYEETEAKMDSLKAAIRQLSDQPTPHQ